MKWNAIEVWGKYLFVFLAAAVVAFLAAFLWRLVARPLGFVDQPGHRRIHAVPVPTGGGLAIFAAFHTACAAIYFLPWLPFAGQLSVEWWRNFAVVSSCVVLVGLADDRLRLNPTAKFAGQIAVALVAFWQGMNVGRLFGVSLPWFADVAVTVLWFLILMNAFNLIDGMDGLAAGLGVVAACGLGLSLLYRHFPGDVLVCLALAGACVGFLHHNFHPAKMFMGDTGSMFLGVTVASIALGTTSKGTAMASVGVAILAVGVPILDAGLAVWRRSVRFLLRPEGAEPEPLWGLAMGDDEHLHHRLLRRGLSQRQVAVVLYAFGAFLGGVGVLSSVQREYALGTLFMAFLVGVYVVVRHLAWIELWDTGVAVLNRVDRRRPRGWAVLLYPVLDVLIMAVSLAIALVLADGTGRPGGLRKEWAMAAPWVIGIPFVLLVASRSYSRVWSRARVSEYALTGLAVFGGILISFCATIFFCEHPLRQCLTAGFLYLGMAVPGVAASRAFFRVVQDVMAWKSRIARESAACRRVLLVGAGPECQLFLKEASLQHDAAQRMRVVGLLDEDPGLRGRWVYGYRVLGGLDFLELAVKSTRAGEICIVDRLGADEVAAILAVAEKRGLSVRQWQTSLQTLRSA